MVDVQVLLPILAFVAVLALVLGVPRLVPARSRGAADRLSGGVTPKIATPSSQAQERVSVMRESAYADLPAWQQRIRKLRVSRQAELDLRQANATWSVVTYLLARVALAIVLGGIAFVVMQQPAAAIIGVIVGWFAPRMYLKRKASKRVAGLEAELAEALDLMTVALTAGHGFMQAMESTARELSGPLREELLRVIEQVNVGGSLANALNELTSRVPSHDMGLFAAAIAVQRQSGGNLAEVLENLSHTVRERRRVKGEVKALTSGPRLSGYILGFMPFAMLGYFAAISADYRTSMFGTTLGKAMIGFAVLWSLTGFFLAQRVAKVDY
ncbi:MAG: type II secretion system F family protein [Chloroflexota bacterium]